MHEIMFASVMSVESIAIVLNQLTQDTSFLKDLGSEGYLKVASVHIGTCTCTFIEYPSDWGRFTLNVHCTTKSVARMSNSPSYMYM